MKKDEILNMPAGREMDYKIARDILNLSALEDSSAGILLPVDIQVKHYSTDMAAARKVVEHFQFKAIIKRALTLSSSIKSDGTPYHWTAWVGLVGATADTAPLAICRAALLSISHD